MMRVDAGPIRGIFRNVPSDSTISSIRRSSPRIAAAACLLPHLRWVDVWMAARSLSTPATSMLVSRRSIEFLYRRPVTSVRPQPD